tara:strand:+ start:303 stop:647 length:345 start_codon:yes stop_codon:yes gene_type:complete
MSTPPTPAPNDSIAQLVDILGEEDARDLVQTFFKEYDELFRKLVSGAREDQHLAAHGLKSSSRHMGLASLAQRFSVLEDRLAKPDGTVDSDDIAIISVEYERAVPPLRKYIQGK